MSENEESLTPEEKLQMENNLLKSKLIAGHGAVFSENEKEHLDPRMENEWLNYIQNFEEAHKNAKNVSVYEFIGKPDFKPLRELDETSIGSELERLKQLMDKNGIGLDCICEYEPRVIYEFITKELFPYEMEDIRIDGMFHNFIYEEFHPNHDHDLRRFADNFFEALLGREWLEYDKILLHDEIRTAAGEKIKQKDFIGLIALFQNSWKGFKIIEKEIISVQFDEQQGVGNVKVSLQYESLSGKNEAARFSGQASIDFLWEYDWWSITKVMVPGFNA